MGGLYLLPRDPAGHGFWEAAVGFELIGIKRAKESDSIEWSLSHIGDRARRDEPRPYFGL